MQRTPGLTAADFDARVKIEGSLSFSGMAGCFSSCFSRDAGTVGLRQVC